MPSVMLLGPVTSGKTESLKTLVAAGLEVFVLKTEPSENLDAMPADKVHWHYVQPAIIPWESQIKNAKLINTLSYKELCNVEEMDRSLYRQYIEVLNTCNDFVDDRTGKHYGDVIKWGHDKAFVIDGLSGLSQMALDMIVGAKPVKGKEQYGVAMSNIEDFVNYLTTSTTCLFVITAHVEREPTNETGAVIQMPATLGQKLAPKLPKYFSDVIHTKREGTEWSWNTLTFGMDLKARNVPFANGMKPDFVPLIKTWRDRILAGQQSASAVIATP
jgi:hypothetical protein